MELRLARPAVAGGAQVPLPDQKTNEYVNKISEVLSRELPAPRRWQGLESLAFDVYRRQWKTSDHLVDLRPNRIEDDRCLLGPVEGHRPLTAHSSEVARLDLDPLRRPTRHDARSEPQVGNIDVERPGAPAADRPDHAGPARPSSAPRPPGWFDRRGPVGHASTEPVPLLRDPPDRDMPILLSAGPCSNKVASSKARSARHRPQALRSPRRWSPAARHSRSCV